jgi:hypothetical protein
LAEREKEGPTPTETKDARNRTSRPVKEGNGHTNASRNVVAPQGAEEEGEQEQTIPEARADHALVVHEVTP